MTEAVERLTLLAEALDMYAQHGGRLISQDDAARCAADLRAALTKPAEGEPVAWLIEPPCGACDDKPIHPNDPCAVCGKGSAPYTRPVAWPEGYKLVPVEPTEAMILAGYPAKATPSVRETPNA